MCSSDIFLGLLALLFPPLPVWVKCGLCSADSIINILLCVLGYLPGLIHAWYIIAKFPEPSYEYEEVSQDSENGRVTYVIVQDDGRRSYRSQSKPKAQGSRSYGTAGNNRNGTPFSAPVPRPVQAAAASAQASGPSHNAGEGSSDRAPPPSYAQVVAGDNKIQSHD